MNNEINKQIKVILEANPDLAARASSWRLSYNKRADMVFFSGEFPAGTFYVNAGDGMMLRIDSNNKIYGFSIENASYFIKRHTEFAQLSFLISPIKSTLFYIALKTVIRPTTNLVQNISAVSQNYLAGKALYAHQ